MSTEGYDLAHRYYYLVSVEAVTYLSYLLADMVSCTAEVKITVTIKIIKSNYFPAVGFNRPRSHSKFSPYGTPNLESCRWCTLKSIRKSPRTFFSHLT